MQTKLIDVLHFYLGCEFKVESINIDDEIIKKLTGSIINMSPLSLEMIITSKELTGKPILSRLSDMTEEEEGEMMNYSGELLGKYKHDIRVNAKRTAWLCKKGYDLFNLIDSGQAIDKKTL